MSRLPAAQEHAVLKDRIVARPVRVKRDHGNIKPLDAVREDGGNNALMAARSRARNSSIESAFFLALLQRTQAGTRHGES